MALAGCGESRPPAVPAINRWDLFASPALNNWRDAEMPGGGSFLRDAEGFTIKDGAPMTGIVYPGWIKDGLPVTDYAITYEAMRVSGSDFFGSVTFPVRDSATFVTFVLGGWGGAQVGISSIDGYDASENTTGSSQRFQTGVWYRVRIEVRSRELRVTLNGRPIILTNILGRTLSLRSGEIDKCVPFGFATYATTGKIRGCVIERIAPAGP